MAHRVQPLQQALHDDDDTRSITVLTDDERPLVFYGDRPGTRKKTDPT